MEAPLIAAQLTAPVFVTLASIVTVIVYLLIAPLTGSESNASPSDLGALALVAGIVIALLAWVVFSFALYPMMSAKRAQPRLYVELTERRRQLCTRFQWLSGDAEGIDEASGHLEFATKQLLGGPSHPSMAWPQGQGYLAVWRALHRAEEAIMSVEYPGSKDMLLGEALHDDLALRTSTVDTKKELRAIIRKSIVVLAPDAGQRLLLDGQDDEEEETSPPPKGNFSEAQAREALREVRHALNAFRDDARDGLIRARARLVWMMLTVSLATLLLLGIALMAGAGQVQMASAAAFYLVGVAVGQFDRLRIEASRSTALEDYGLHRARIFATVLVSGVAAVGGVFLVEAVLSLAPEAPEFGSLDDVYNVVSNPLGLLYAAVFGLTPRVLTALVSNQAERLEKDLLSSRPADSAVTQS